MVELSIEDIAGATGAGIAVPAPGRVCRGVVIDSRKVEKGSVFVAFPGENVDGNRFAPQAIEAGAGCVVLTVEPEPAVAEAARSAGAAVLVTPDPTQFLLDLASWYRDRLDCIAVGVTGSIGKTTTKDVLAALLSVRYRVHVTQGNLNNLIGCPLTILSAPADTQVLVLEMGMNHLHEIERLSACGRPSYAVITKVGTSHIGILGSRENIARAKAEIISGMRAADGERAPVLVLHGEDDFAPFIEENFAAPAGVEVVRCGTSESDDVRIGDVEVGGDGCPSFSFTLPGEPERTATLSIPGAQSVPNAGFAIAVAARLGIAPDEIARALGEVSITVRRTQVRAAASGARVIDDSYNASAESMAAGLDLLASLPCDGQRIAVLGEMGEMGDEAPRMHALVGAYAAAKHLGLLVCVGGELAREMAAAASLMGMDDGDIRVVADVEELISSMSDILGGRDLALVKGSRFVGLDAYVEEVCRDAR